jgi:hypothetical protein
VVVLKNHPTPPFKSGVDNSPESCFLPKYGRI